MGIKTKGLQELTDYLDKMGKIQDKVANQALMAAGDYVRDVEYKVVTKRHHKYSEGDIGAKELKRYPVRVGARMSRYCNIGIRAKQTAAQKKKDAKNTASGAHRPTQWDKVKGLWYNNYGFVHNRTGEYIAGSNWIETAYNQSIDEAYRIIQKKIMEGLKL